MIHWPNGIIKTRLPSGDAHAKYPFYSNLLYEMGHYFLDTQNSRTFSESATHLKFCVLICTY